MVGWLFISKCVNWLFLNCLISFSKDQCNSMRVRLRLLQIWIVQKNFRVVAVFGCTHCTVSFQVFGSYAKLNFVQRVSARSNFSNALRLANTFSWDCNVHLLAFRPLTIFFFENHNCNMLLSFFNWDLWCHFAWKCIYNYIFNFN